MEVTSTGKMSRVVIIAVLFLTTALCKFNHCTCTSLLIQADSASLLKVLIFFLSYPLESNKLSSLCYR